MRVEIGQALVASAVILIICIALIPLLDLLADFLKKERRKG